MAAQAAYALDEAQITDITCDGLRVTQQGLPPGLEVEVVVLNAPKGTELAEVYSRVSAAGRVDVRVPVNLRGVAQIVVEVEQRSDGTEYGEAAADLKPCTPAPAGSAPAAVPAPVTNATPLPFGPVAPGRRSAAASVTTPATASEATPGAEPPAAAPDTSGVPGLLLGGVAALLIVTAGVGLLARRRLG